MRVSCNEHESSYILYIYTYRMHGPHYARAGGPSLGRGAELKLRFLRRCLCGVRDFQVWDLGFGIWVGLMGLMACPGRPSLLAPPGQSSVVEWVVGWFSG